MLESKYQADLITRLKYRFEGCEILKNDANYIQGFPDLLILFGNGKWAALEVKASDNAPCRPNQIWYVDRLNTMGFSRIICPENETDVLVALEDYILG